MENTKNEYIEFHTLKESDDILSSFSDEASELIRISDQIYDLISALKEEREAQGYSTRELARKVNLKQPAVVRFERLDTIPRLDTFLKIANALQVKINLSRPVYQSSFVRFCDNSISYNVKNNNSSVINCEFC